jgi:phospholipid/cholesterol/gamma-HCH transport system substrate-binding protein
VILVALVAAYALLRAKMPKTSVGGSFKTYARFRDGSRLALGSPVEIAGVRVGEVKRLTIEGVFARVDLVLLDSTDIPADSWITKRAESAFGDSYLEIIPVSAGDGATPARRLVSGEPIIHVIEGGSTDTALRALSRSIPKVERGLESIHEFALTTRKWTRGPFEDAIVGADRWLDEGHVDGPIAAADHAMATMERGSERARDAVVEARPEVDQWFERTNRSITNARRQMADGRTGIQDGLKNAREGIDKIDPTIEQLHDVVAAVDEGRGDDGKGKLGRLINDPELGETLDDASEGGVSAAHSLDPFKTWLGIRAEWNVFAGTSRVYVTAELEGHNDRFYLIEGSKGGQGALPHDQVDEVLDAQQYNRRTEISEGARFTMEFGKRIGPLRLRGGLKESTFGLGSDLLLNSGRLKLSADVFGGFSYTPRVKLAAALQVFKLVYISAGADDVFVAPRYLAIETGNTQHPDYFNKLRYGRDYFVGAELRLNEADLGAMVRIYGSMLAALLL